MDIKPLIIEKLDKLTTIASDLSMGEVLYEILRSKHHLSKKPEGVDTSWLVNLSDEDIFTAIERTIAQESK